MTMGANLETSASGQVLHKARSTWNDVLAALREKSPAGNDVVDYDWQRIERALYGHYHFSQPAGATILDVGGGSGVAAFWFCCTAGGKYMVYAVVSDDEARARFFEIAEAHNLHNILFFANLNDARRAVAIEGKKINFLRIEKTAFLFAELKELLEAHQVDIVYGEYDDPAVDALDLYRLCAAKAASFYWYSPVLRDIVAGDHWSGPEVSVIVKTHSDPARFKECLESLVNQSLKAKEIIIVNNTSNNVAAAIAEEYQKQNPGIIQIIKQKSNTRAAAWSIGRRAVKGQYIGFIDANDSLDLGRFEKLYRAAALARAEISFPNINGYSGVLTSPHHLIDSEQVITNGIYRVDFLASHNLDFPHDMVGFEQTYFYCMSLFYAGRVVVGPDNNVENLTHDIQFDNQKLFACFNVFNLLKKQIDIGGCYFSELAFKKVQIKTHMKALSLLSGDQRKQYFKKAIQDLSQDNCYVSHLDVLRAASRMSSKEFVLVFRLLFLKF